MKRILSLVLMAVLVLALATGCGKSDGQSGGGNSTTGEDTTGAGKATEIVWLSQGVGDNSWEGRTKSILAAYEEETGVKVKGEFYSFNDLFDIIEVKIASGSSDYDAISVDVPMVAAYATRKYLMPVDDYFSAEEKSLFIDSAVEAGSWDGVFYAPPMNTSTQVLWYNTKLLDEAEVQIPENSTEKRLTWEQVADLAKQTVEKLDPDGTNGIIGLDFQQASRVYQMNALPNSMGGKNIGDDGYTVGGVINNDAWVKSLTWYQDLVKQGISSKGINADEMSNYFYSDKLVFMVGGTWTAGNCEANGMTTYGWAPCPAFEGYEDSVATPTGSWHFGVNTASKNTDAAAEFIKWMSLGKGNDMWLEVNGDMPSRKDKLDEIINDANAQEYLKIGAYEASNTSVPRALTPGYNEYSTILNATWEDIRNGADVKQALDNAVAQINTAMEKYK